MLPIIQGAAGNIVGNAVAATVESIQSGLEHIQELTAKSEADAKTKAATEGVESLFLSMMLKEMRNTLSEGGLFGGENSDVYGGLFDMMMSKTLAKDNPLGIANMITTQIDRQSLGLGE